MRLTDRLLQRWRIRKVAPYIRPGDRLLDVGCHQGELIDYVRGRISSAVGIDPVAEPAEREAVVLLRGALPGDPRLAANHFDSITMLAAMEHLDDPREIVADCYRLLRPGGRFVITVPHPFVDRIVDLLVRLGIADGMDFEAHHGFDVSAVEPMVTRIGFQLVARRRFQLGLNRLFVFQKPAGVSVER